MFIMKKYTFIAAAMLPLILSCKMENPLLTESKLPFGAPQFDKIRNEHYMEGIAEGRREIEAIANNPEAPTFENTIEAMEYSGETLDRVSSIFYNLMEADVNEQMQQIAAENEQLQATVQQQQESIDGMKKLISQQSAAAQMASTAGAAPAM